MLALDIQQVISQALCFILLWVILKRVAWGPLLEVIDSRKETIEQDLKQAEATRQGMEKLKVELNQRLAEIDAEARGKIQESINEKI